MEIETKSLTTCEVDADGAAVSLGLVDQAGLSRTIKLSLDQLSALAMTLPGLLNRALQTQYGERSLRYVFPLQSWAVEQSADPSQRMVTLTTGGGFSVCFSILRDQQNELCEALACECRSADYVIN